jgi:four helix bundle protein
MLNINNVFSPETNFRLILLVTVLGLIYIPKLAFCTFDLIFFLTKKRWRSIQYCGYVAVIAFALTILHGIFIKRFDFKKGEYVVSRQICKSGTSIGANIAEAQRVQSTADFVSKMKIALKEANETQYWLKLLHESKYLSDKEHTSLHDDLLEILKILTAICKHYPQNNQ